MGPLVSSCWNFCFSVFFWCLSMFGASSGLFFVVPVNVSWSQSHQTCTGTKKTKPLDAPNLHRHQQKQKKLKFPGFMGPLLNSCSFFFVFFGACQCFVKSESPNLHRHQKTKKNKPLDAPNLHRHQKKLKFPGFMGPLLSSCSFFCFFWCLSMFREVRVTKPAQAPKKPNH